MTTKGTPMQDYVMGKAKLTQIPPVTPSRYTVGLEVRLAALEASHKQLIGLVKELTQSVRRINIIAKGQPPRA